MFMKLFLVAFVAVVNAAPEQGYAPPTQYHHSEHIPILKDERFGPDQYGNYQFEFETGNGINRKEQGAPGEEGAVVIEGGWWFTFPDGTPGHLTFVADENGFRPVSDLLPVPPPMPQHAIDQIRYALEQDSVAASGHAYPLDRYN